MNELSFLSSQKVLCASFPSLKISSLQSRVMAYLCDFCKQQRQNPKALHCLMAQIKKKKCGEKTRETKMFSNVLMILSPSHLGFVEKYELRSQEEFFSTLYARFFFKELLCSFCSFKKCGAIYYVPIR